MANEAVVTIAVIILGPIPAIMKSLVLIFPAALTMAFGGVPTGRWKENEQPRAAGTIR